MTRVAKHRAAEFLHRTRRHATTGTSGSLQSLESVSGRERASRTFEGILLERSEKKLLRLRI